MNQGGPLRAAARCLNVVARWPRLLLLAVVAAPFVPAGLEMIRAGMPDILFEGDMGALELRTLFAARGTQLVGPYSRFNWSHPGPAFFYLATPFYEAFRQRGPALHVFVLVGHFVAMGTLVLIARRLLGNVYALVVAALLAVFEMTGPPIALWQEWNPIVPVLPLALLLFLAARLGSGGITALAGVCFVASVIVQTHVGYAPGALLLLGLGGGFYGGRRLLSPRADARERRRILRAVVAAAAVLVVVWLPPIYENATRRPGNLHLLYEFFTSRYRSEHTWQASIDTVAGQLTVMPLAFARLFAAVAAPSSTVVYTLVSLQLAALIATLALAARRRDGLTAFLSLAALGQIVVAVLAVRAIRGPLLDYLLVWISVLGLVGHAAIAAGLVGAAVRRLGPRAAGLALGVPAVLLVVVAVWAGAGRIPLVYRRDEKLERLAREVEAYLRAQTIDHPIVSIASHDIWAETVGLVLWLEKHQVPVYVDRDWLYVFGNQLAADTRPHRHLLVGDAAFGKIAAARRDRTLVAASGDLNVYLDDPDYLQSHRVAGPIVLLSTSGALGDPRRIVDGVIPPDGTDWQSPLSVVLGTASVNTVEVAVPSGDLAGLFVCADGNDTYVLRCLGADGSSSRLGVTPSPALGDKEGAGMRTRMVFADGLAACRSIELTPEGGDGFYSIGEVGFLRR